MAVTAGSGLQWRESNLGTYHEIKVAVDNHDRLWLLWPHKCDNDIVYNYVDEAREQRGVQFKYGDESQEGFAQDVLDDDRHVLEMHFRNLKNDENRTRNIDPVLKDRLEGFLRLKPQQLVVTGRGAEVLTLFNMESDTIPSK